MWYRCSGMPKPHSYISLVISTGQEKILQQSMPFRGGERKQPEEMLWGIGGISKLNDCLDLGQWVLWAQAKGCFRYQMLRGNEKWNESQTQNGVQTGYCPANHSLTLLHKMTHERNLLLSPVVTFSEATFLSRVYVLHHILPLKLNCNKLVENTNNHFILHYCTRPFSRTNCWTTRTCAKHCLVGFWSCFRSYAAFNKKAAVPLF